MYDKNDYLTIPNIPPLVFFLRLSVFDARILFLLTPFCSRLTVLRNGFCSSALGQTMHVKISLVWKSFIVADVIHLQRNHVSLRGLYLPPRSSWHGRVGIPLTTHTKAIALNEVSLYIYTHESRLWVQQFLLPIFLLRSVSYSIIETVWFPPLKWIELIHSDAAPLNSTKIL